MNTITPPTQHNCNVVLGGAATVPKGTLRKCTECGTWYYAGEMYVGFGFSEVWWPVMPWHFRKKWRIRKGEW